MIVYNYLFVVITVFSLGTTGQRRLRSRNGSQLNLQNNAVQRSNLEPDRTAEIEGLNAELEKVNQETAVLNAESAELKKATENVKTECQNEIITLNQQYEEMMEKTSEHNRILQDILKKIQEEEAEHIRLEAELRKISEVLEVIELQYLVVIYDFKLMERRRNNGTTARCSDVTFELAADEESLKTRAHLMNPYRNRRNMSNNHDLIIKPLQSKLKIRKLMLNSVQASLEALKRQYKNELEECNANRANMNALIKAAALGLETTEQSIKILQSDLEASIATSQAVRLEIKTGKSFIQELREKINNMKKGAENFIEDTACFNNIKSVD